MSAPDPKKWMPLHIGPYDRATNRLSLAEDGAYMRLLRDYWVNGAPPDDDAQIARILRVERREWAKIRPAIVRFFDVRDGHWYQERMEAELDKARAITEARRLAGQKGGKSKSKPQAIASDELEQNPTHARVASPSPSPTEEEDADASSVGSAEPMPTAKGRGEPWLKDADFVAAWAACTEEGRARSSRRKAWEEWRKHAASGVEKLAALKAYLARDPDVKRTGGPGFHLWLRDKLDEWLDRPTPEAATPATWHGPEAIVRLMTPAFGRDKAEEYLAAYGSWQEVPYPAVIISHEPMAKLILSKCGAAFQAESIAILVKGRAA